MSAPAIGMPTKLSVPTVFREMRKSSQCAELSPVQWNVCTPDEINLTFPPKTLREVANGFECRHARGTRKNKWPLSADRLYSCASRNAFHETVQVVGIVSGIARKSL